MASILSAVVALLLIQQQIVYKNALELLKKLLFRLEMSNNNVPRPKAHNVITITSAAGGRDVPSLTPSAGSATVFSGASPLQRTSPSLPGTTGRTPNFMTRSSRRLASAVVGQDKASRLPGADYSFSYMCWNTCLAVSLAAFFFTALYCTWQSSRLARTDLIVEYRTVFDQWSSQYTSWEGAMVTVSTTASASSSVSLTLAAASPAPVNIPPLETASNIPTYTSTVTAASAAGALALPDISVPSGGYNISGPLVTTTFTVTVTAPPAGGSSSTPVSTIVTAPAYFSNLINGLRSKRVFATLTSLCLVIEKAPDGRMRLATGASAAAGCALAPAAAPVGSSTVQWVTVPQTDVCVPGAVGASSPYGFAFAQAAPPFANGGTASFSGIAVSVRVAGDPWVWALQNASARVPSLPPAPTELTFGSNDALFGAAATALWVCSALSVIALLSCACCACLPDESTASTLRRMKESTAVPGLPWLGRYMEASNQLTRCTSAVAEAEPPVAAAARVLGSGKRPKLVAGCCVLLSAAALSVMTALFVWAENTPPFVRAQVPLCAAQGGGGGAAAPSYYTILDAPLRVAWPTDAQADAAPAAGAVLKPIAPLFISAVVMAWGPYLAPFVACLFVCVSIASGEGCGKGTVICGLLTSFVLAPIASIIVFSIGLGMYHGRKADIPGAFCELLRARPADFGVGIVPDDVTCDSPSSVFGSAIVAVTAIGLIINCSHLCGVGFAAPAASKKLKLCG